MITLTLEDIVKATRGRTLGAPPPGNATGVSIDSRTLRPGDVFFAVKGDRFDGHDFVEAALRDGAAAAVVSRRELLLNRPLGAPPMIWVENTVDALAALAAFHRRRHPATVVAVTGSNGKTTTRELIYHLLSGSRKGSQARASHNNHIGVPLTLLAVEPTDEFVVLELGTNHPGEIAALARLAAPDIGVLTAIAPAHLEGLRDLPGVAREKCSLFDFIVPGGLAVVPADEPLVARCLPHRPRMTVVRFGTAPDAALRLTSFTQEPDGIRFRINGRFEMSMPLLGRHNALNALAAIVVGRRFGLDERQIAARLATAAAPPMRLQAVRVGPIDLLLDAYNANPGSMTAALDVFDAMQTTRRRVLVLGDMAELGAHSESLHRELGRRIAQSRWNLLLTVGTQMRVAADAIPPGRAHHHFDSTDALARDAAHFLQPGDVALLKGSRSMRLEQLVDALKSAARRRRTTPKKKPSPAPGPRANAAANNGAKPAAKAAAGNGSNSKGKPAAKPVTGNGSTTKAKAAAKPKRKSRRPAASSTRKR